jgi:hypothetical protein
MAVVGKVLPTVFFFIIRMRQQGLFVRARLQPCRKTPERASGFSR